MQLVVNDLVQVQGIDPATLATGHTITPAALIQQQALDDAPLVVYSDISPHDLIQEQALSSPVVGAQGLWHAFAADVRLRPALTATVAVSPRWALQCTIRPMLKH